MVMSSHLSVRSPERDGSFFNGPMVSPRKHGRELRQAAAQTTTAGRESAKKKNRSQTQKRGGALIVPRLTSRENEVLHWIGEGKRDREIATILNLSSRTIQKHVQHILEKLQVETRGAAAAWWHDYAQ
jgi:DNA-binding NarL/FixJ family response regulator